MSINHERLEQLLICIGAKCDLQEEIERDARFGMRLQQNLRGCLGATTRDTEAFMESVFGRASMKAYREARRLSREPLHRPVGASTERDLRPSPAFHETSH
jgi:hypothetical protein